MLNLSRVYMTHLAALHLVQPATAKQVADRLNRRKSNTLRILGQLISLGLVVRRRPNAGDVVDKRQHIYELSVNGSVIGQELYQVHQHIQEHLQILGGR